MGENTGISWTNHTWNPWRGCTKVSPGCAHCYMFTGQERYKRDPAKVVETKTTWNDPYGWSKLLPAGKVERVFTCSWSDFFHVDADEFRARAWRIIKETPNLHYQILTKRPENILDRLPADWASGYPNVWLGVSVENPAFLWRVDTLRKIPARVRFISAEPLLAPLPTLDLDGIHWLIIGGESGPGFRPMPHEWAQELLAIARAANVPFFFKQSAAIRTEMGIYLEGKRYKEFPKLTEQPAVAS